MAMQAGLILMAAAATLGLLELPEHSNKIVVPNQPAFALSPQFNDPNGNTLRREREEVAPHYVSYSVTQRTPSRTGKF